METPFLFFPVRGLFVGLGLYGGGLMKTTKLKPPPEINQTQNLTGLKSAFCEGFQSPRKRKKSLYCQLLMVSENFGLYRSFKTYSVKHLFCFVRFYVFKPFVCHT
jgi:hypothetical protein